MSLFRLDQASKVVSDATTGDSLINKMTALAEKFLSTPTGVGLFAIGAGVLLRQTHQPAKYVLNPGVKFQGTGLPPPEAIAYWIPANSGALDRVVWSISTAELQTIQDTVVGAVSKAASAFNPFLGLFIQHALENNADPNSGKVNILLSDILIIAGAACVGGSAISAIIPKI